MNTRRHAFALLGLAVISVTGLSGASCGPAPTLATVDSNSHRSGFIRHHGVRLHYLEWGGRGPAVVLLPGYALTAHAFDEIGTQLSSDFRVVAITPRGFGESDAPDSSDYSIGTMVADLRTVLDSLGIQRAALAGHSFSGFTISEFALAHPARVTRLVYLDAFPYWAAAGGDSIGALSPVSPQSLSEPMTYPRVREFLHRYRFGGWSAALEADLQANQLGAEMERRRGLTEGYIRDQADNPVELGAIAVPALQVCAIPTVETEYPWLREHSEEYSQAARYVRDVFQPFARRLCTRFGEVVPRGRTIEVTGSHYVFFTQPAQAASLIRQFLVE